MEDETIINSEIESWAKANEYDDGYDQVVGFGTEKYSIKPCRQSTGPLPIGYES